MNKDPLGALVDNLRAEQDCVKEKEERASEEDKNDERQVRLRHKARRMSDEDVVHVLMMSKGGRCKRGKGDVGAEGVDATTEAD